MSKQLDISIQTGGGVRSYADVCTLLDAGINQVICTSMVVKNEADWFLSLKRFGGERCILGMDLKNGQVAHSGWLETIEEDTYDFLRRNIEAGVQTVLCTDISKDGTLSGPNLDLYKQLREDFP
ncbi:HisA/HisF-related TIM barrel protein, partial [Arthrospira platensis SPKY1]|nr:HisA/HisF-related TIM barrel protein [Arthrospira platensis SPKY1]